MVAMVLLVGSCAAMQQRQARQMEEILAEAGFRRKPADTADKVTHLNGLKPDQMVSFVKDGKTLYAYADPTGCHCLLVGDEQAYQHYQTLVDAPQIAQDQEMAAREKEDGADDAGTDWEYANGPLWW
jgi:hypothetical protein